MTNIKNNLEKEVNRINSEWIKILYGEDKGVKMKEIKQNPIFKIKEEDLSSLLPTFDFKKNEELVKEKLIKALENAHPQLILNDEMSEAYGYYKGFHDAARQMMQTFNKLIEAGAFSGTKTNSNN